MPPDTPDFDSMSPEEVMAWLESLAKRQGAREGFITAANMDIPEIDPSTVVIDEPGYVPYGETPPAKPSRPAPPRAEPPGDRTAPIVTPAPTRAELPAQPAKPPQPAPARVEQPAASAPQPATAVSLAHLPFADEAVEQETQVAPPPVDQGLAWLERLAADQGGDFPQLDLAALTFDPTPPPAQPPANSLSWLEDLAGSAPTAAPPAPAVAPAASAAADLASVQDPLAAGVDPIAWLESLALSHGARPEEMTRQAHAVSSAPKSAPTPANPMAWLESLTDASSAEPALASAAPRAPMSDEEIRHALQTGAEIPPDQMAAFLDRQLTRQIEGGQLSAQALDGEAQALPVTDPDAPPIPADIPAWLLEQVELPPSPGKPQRPPLVEEIVEPPAVQDLPDWLRDDFGEQLVELEDIFAAEEPEPAAAAELIDTSDPWVEAFEQEAQMPDVASGELPEWYVRNLNDPARRAAVERLARGKLAAAEEAEAVLPPETYLPPGEPEAVPEWASVGTLDPVGASDVSDLSDLPKWLRDAVANQAGEDLPDWLNEAAAQVKPEEIPDRMPQVVEVAEPSPTPARIAVEQPQPTLSVVAAVTKPAAAFDTSALLTSARASVSAGDLDAGLASYEQIVRANAALDVVVDDLTELVERHADNPAVYRVLGDGLMRLGRLQAALDTYRKALNRL